MKYSKNIPYFRGVFMRDGLPQIPFPIECGIINLDSSQNSGTHWVAYTKINDCVEYFDSYGNLRPPKEFIRYMKKCKVIYNYDNFQKNNSYNCGHLCLGFLNKFWRKLSILK